MSSSSIERMMCFTYTSGTGEARQRKRGEGGKEGGREGRRRGGGGEDLVHAGLLTSETASGKVRMSSRIFSSLGSASVKASISLWKMCVNRRHNCRRCPAKTEGGGKRGGSRNRECRTRTRCRADRVREGPPLSSGEGEGREERRGRRSTVLRMLAGQPWPVGGWIMSSSHREGSRRQHRSNRGECLCLFIPTTVEACCRGEEGNAPCARAGGRSCPGRRGEEAEMVRIPLPLDGGRE